MLALSVLQVLQAEAAQPLVSQEQLQKEGQMPRVLVQSSAGGGLVATPAAGERKAMYQAEKDYTGERQPIMHLACTAG